MEMQTPRTAARMAEVKLAEATVVAASRARDVTSSQLSGMKERYRTGKRLHRAYDAEFQAVRVLAAAQQALSAQQRSLRVAALVDAFFLLPAADNRRKATHEPAVALYHSAERAMRELLDAAVTCIEAQGTVDVMRFPCYGGQAPDEDEARREY